MGGGHYYAYCRDYDNNWREYNDSSINTLCSTGDSEERLSSILNAKILRICCFIEFVINTFLLNINIV